MIPRWLKRRPTILAAGTDPLREPPAPPHSRRQPGPGAPAGSAEQRQSGPAGVKLLRGAQSQPSDGKQPRQAPRAAANGPARPPLPNLPALRQGERPHPAFSDEALRRAWQQLKANGGGPGVDGVDIASFEARLKEHLAVLQAELSQGSYRPQPVRRVLIPKRNEGLRPLAVWTLRDRLAQRAVLNAVEPLFEPLFLPCSHGFRPGRSVQTAAEMVGAARDEGLRWVLDADIKECFENIDPVLLMRLVRRRLKDKRLLGLIDCWLQARVLTAGGQMRAAGTAQGGVLSPLLCNVYLHEFDSTLVRQQLRLVRYADDFVVLQRRRREAEAAQAAAQEALAVLRLEFNLYKTRIVSFDQGFKFLGMFFVRDEVFVL